MPSTDTITAFYTFTANTKARASEVTNNFSVYRGHIIPVSSDTQTASNLTYNLGSTNYRWNGSYSKELFLGSTTTSWSITDSTTTVGDLSFKLNNTEAISLKKGHNRYTVTANSGTYANTLTSATLITNFSLTMTTYGQPVEISFVPDNSGLPTGDFPYIEVLGNDLEFAQAYIEIRRDASTICSFNLLNQVVHASAHSLTLYRLPVSTIKYIDFSATAGTYVYSAYGRVQATGAISFNQLRVNYARLFARLF